MNANFDFYCALAERWESLFSETNPPNRDPKQVPRLTQLALETLRKCDLSQVFVPSLPHSLIKEVLPNGFTLLVQELVNPKTTELLASMRLVVKAGSLHEEDDQIGLAHLLEHALFQGTSSFNSTQMRDLFDQLGCPGGIDNNAETHFTHTSYYLNQIPLQNKDLWDQCSRLFFEFCNSPSFPLENMINERQVVESELLARKNIDRDRNKHMRENLYPGSRYTKRFPSDLGATIKQATGKELQEILLKFYHKWYVPQNMALIVVGNFGDSLTSVKYRTKLIENLRVLFGRIPANENFVNNLCLDPSLDEKFQVNLAWTHSLRTCSFAYPSNVVTISRRIKDVNGSFFENQKKELEENIFADVLNSQLTSLTQQDETPIKKTAFYTFSIKYTDSIVESIAFEAISEKTQAALTLLTQEFKRLEIQELPEVFLKNHLNQMKRSELENLQNHPNSKFSSLSQNYEKYFISNQPYLSTTLYNAIMKILILEKLNMKNMNDIIHKNARMRCQFVNQDIVIRRDSSDPAQKGEEEIEKLKNILETPISEVSKHTRWNLENNWSDKFKQTPTISPELSKHISEINTTIWTFPNQIEVIYKHVPSLTSQVILEFVAPKGLIHFSRQEVLHFIFALQIFYKLGCNNKTNKEFSVHKDNISLKESLNVDFRHTKFIFQLKNGQCLEDVLQILYFYLTDASAIFSEDFQTMWENNITQYKDTLKKLKGTEKGELSQARTQLLWDDIIYKNITLEEIEQLDYQQGQQILSKVLREMVCPQAQLLICGNIRQENVQPLMEKYIGSLSTSSKLVHQDPQTIKSLPFTPNQQIILFEGSIPNRSTMELFMCVQRPTSAKEHLHFTIAQYIIHQFLNLEMRYKEQLTYGVSFNFLSVRDNYLWLYAQTTFTTEMDKIDDLKNRVNITLDQLLKLEDTDLQSCLDNQKTIILKSLANHNDLIRIYSALTYCLSQGFELTYLSNQEQWVKEMTIDDLKAALHKILDRRNESKILVLHPKNNQ